MNTWFRVYNNLVDDPKVQKLHADLFKALVNLWCLASQNDGVLPSTGDIAFKLRLRPERAAMVLTELFTTGLLDKNEEGRFVPHAWSTRQYKSDGSAERMRRHRSKDRDVTNPVTVTSPVTGPEAEQKQIRSEAEQTRAAVSKSEGKGEQSDTVVRVLKTDLMEAFGASRCPDLDRATEWIAKGYAPSMCVEVVRELLTRKPDIANLAYFDKALADRHAKRAFTPSERATSVPPETMDWAVGHFAKGGHWSRHVGPEPGQPGCRATPEMLAKHGLGRDGQRLKVTA